MRRVTIEEAARCLDVDEEEVKTRMKDGSLVACQGPEFQGYVWLTEAVQQPPKRKSRGKAPASGPQKETAEPPTKRRARSTSPEAGPKPEAGPEEKERRPRASQRAQEVQLLQETVAMLKAELENRDKQLEIKDAEIEARRAEVKELLALLQQVRALPPVPLASEDVSDSIVVNLKTAYTLCMDRVAYGVDVMLSQFYSLLFRAKAKIRSMTRRGQASLPQIPPQGPGDVD